MTYSLTSNKFEGEVLFTFSDKGLLIKMEVLADFTFEQQEGLFKIIPGNLATLIQIKAKWNHLTFTEVQTEVTFEMMWDRYNDKTRSSKKKSLTAWNKHNKANQIKAYNHFPKYDRNRGTAEKKYLETYLNAELWNN